MWYSGVPNFSIKWKVLLDAPFDRKISMKTNWFWVSEYTNGGGMIIYKNLHASNKSMKNM